MRKLDTEAEGCRRDAVKAAEKHFRVRFANAVVIFHRYALNIVAHAMMQVGFAE